MQKPSLRVERIGHEGQPVAIIDNFAPDPDRVRTAALGLSYHAVDGNYPGIRADVPPSYFDGLGAVLVPVIRGLFGSQQRANFIGAYYSLATTPPCDLALQQRIPHIDRPETNQLAIVHYLSHEDQGGTAFYRHRSTGYETVTTERHANYIAALEHDFARHGEPPPSYISGDTELFERVLDVAPLYNRAILFRCCLLHCAMLPNDKGLPTDSANGRLTAVSFVTLS
ncbi:MAG: DUF6445 family protein [Sphingopyxis sp.]